MARSKDLLTQIEIANALGVANLKKKGVELPETATTHQIMQSIADIESVDGEISEFGQYIESTGEQYIDLGIKAKSSLKVQLAVIIDTNLDGSLFGAFDIDGDVVLNRMGLHSVTGTNMYYYYGANGGFPYYSSNVKSTNAITCFVVDNNILKENGKEKITRTKEDFVSTSNLYLFVRNNGGDVVGFASMKLFRFTVYDNGELIMDLIPAVSKEIGHENEVCLYDKVTSEYFYNQGTGSFTMGNLWNEQ